MSNQVDDYIDRQASPQREICQHLRQLISRTIPGISEEMKWGVPAFDGGRFYLVALKDHVNLGFATKGLSQDEIALFDGGGKTNKHLAIARLEDIDEPRIIGLLKLVASRA